MILLYILIKIKPDNLAAQLMGGLKQLLEEDRNHSITHFYTLYELRHLLAAAVLFQHFGSYFALRIRVSRIDILWS